MTECLELSLRLTHVRLDKTACKTDVVAKNSMSSLVPALHT